jgi:hypothetical protein
MNDSPNKLVFHADGTLSVRIGGKWRNAISQVTRSEYMALPYEAKKRLLLTEFASGRELIEGTRLMVARH